MTSASRTTQCIGPQFLTPADNCQREYMAPGKHKGIALCPNCTTSARGHPIIPNAYILDANDTFASNGKSGWLHKASGAKVKNGRKKIFRNTLLYEADIRLRLFRNEDGHVWCWLHPDDITAAAEVAASFDLGQRAKGTLRLVHTGPTGWHIQFIPYPRAKHATPAATHAPKK